MKPLPFHILEIWKRYHLPDEASHGAEYPHQGFCILFNGQKLSEQGFFSGTFLSHLVHCAPGFIIIGIPFCSSEFSVSEIRAWNFGGWIFGPGIFWGFDFCLHSNIPRADYSWSSPASLRIQNTSSGVLPSSLHQSHLSLTLACEQALLFGQAKRVSRERASERRSLEGPLARAFSRGLFRSPK